MEIAFVPSPDVAAVLNSLLDIFERRKAPGERSIKVDLADLALPAYFSQTDPMARITANEQLAALEKAGYLKLAWLPGESGHLLRSAALNPQQTAAMYALLNRSAKVAQQRALELLLLADKFRYADDWRTRALRHVLENLRAGKSPAPFSLANPGLNADLLAIMEGVSTLQAETPYRVFSVRVFNDSKRLEALRGQLVSLARIGAPEWRRFTSEEVLRELNLVPNPTYLHMAGAWQLVLDSGEILPLGGFAPAVGFPAAQAAQLRAVTVHAEAVLCIENLTSFHEYVRHSAAGGPAWATLCSFGNPSPAVRRLLSLLPVETPIYHWSDLDYGGFNILGQLRRLVSARVQAYRMDIATLESNYARSRPLTLPDRANLKKLLARPELSDARPVIEHLLKRGVKLEQEGIQLA